MAEIETELTRVRGEIDPGSSIFTAYAALKEGVRGSGSLKTDTLGEFSEAVERRRQELLAQEYN